MEDGFQCGLPGYEYLGGKWFDCREKVTVISLIGLKATIKENTGGDTTAIYWLNKDLRRVIITEMDLKVWFRTTKMDKSGLSHLYIQTTIDDISKVLFQGSDAFTSKVPSMVGRRCDADDDYLDEDADEEYDVPAYHEDDTEDVVVQGLDDLSVDVDVVCPDHVNEGHSQGSEWHSQANVGHDHVNEENSQGFEWHSHANVGHDQGNVGHTEVPEMGLVDIDQDDQLFINESARIDVMCPKPPTGDGSLVKDKQWANIYVCRDFLRFYAIRNNFKWKFKNNDSDKIIIVCKKQQCTWRCYVKRMTDGKTMRCNGIQPIHTCIGDASGLNEMANSPLIAKVIEEQIRMHHRVFTPNYVMQEMWFQHKVIIKYWQAWNSMQIALERVHGSYEDSFKHIPELCRQVILTNPGSVATFSIDHKTETYTGFCLTFKACIDGFVNGCRPILALDGCFLKDKYSRHAGDVENMDIISKLAKEGQL